MTEQEPEPLPPPPDAVDGKFDFTDEEPTQPEACQTMEEVLEELRSPGILTSTSERPTRPIRAIRPSTRWRWDDEEENCG